MILNSILYLTFRKASCQDLDNRLLNCVFNGAGYVEMFTNMRNGDIIEDEND